VHIRLKLVIVLVKVINTMAEYFKLYKRWMIHVFTVVTQNSRVLILSISKEHTTFIFRTPQPLKMKAVCSFHMMESITQLI
jgi:hypothetical protein